MVRIAQAADVEDMLNIYAPYVEGTTVTFEYDVPSEAEFRERFLGITEQFPWLVWEEDGAILGYAYASAPYSRAAYRWCAEPSVYLRPEARGRGIGRKLYAALEELLTGQGYQLLYALVTEENTASMGFHRHLGYETRARFPDCAWKFGRSLGVVWMEKRLSSVQIPRGFPVPWTVFRQDEQKISDILDNLSLF